MNASDPTLRALEQAFASGGVPTPEACPPAEALWSARHGEGDAEDRRRTVEHLARCAGCAADWTLLGPAEDSPMGAGLRPARAGHSPAPTRHGPAPTPQATEPPRVRRPRRWPLLLGAAAAVVLIVLVVRVPLDRDAPPPAVERSAESAGAAAIRALAGTDAVLPRDRAVLRWTDLGPEARYTLDVAGEDLALLVTARGLARPEYALPAGALAAVPAGGSVTWRVEAVLPDGRRVASEAFRARVD